MSGHRIANVTVTALLAATVLGLTACDPEGADAGNPSTVAASPVTSATTAGEGAAGTGTASAGAGATPTAQPSGRPTGKTSAKPSGKPSPVVDCTAAAQRPGHQVVHVTAVSATGLTAQKTVFTCGPDVDNDGYYTATGSAQPYHFASGATATVVDLGAGSAQRAVPLPTLVEHLGGCLAHADGEQCFGDNYDVTVDSAGRVTTIAELFHP
ncbi:hypothetical protein [Kitasatospora sp. NPDC094015]|uniref:hypothetical protein n=1 Tax=Kitasatospora sp. NPDC094015 TaxID=3155205 RepID=UPI0033327E13